MKPISAPANWSWFQWMRCRLHGSLSDTTKDAGDVSVAFQCNDCGRCFWWHPHRNKPACGSKPITQGPKTDGEK